MKPIISALFVTLLSLTTAHADFLRVEAGVGSWQSEPTGSLRDDSGNKVTMEDNLGYDTKGLTYVWFNFKHFVPVLPNLRLEYTGMEFKGNTSGTFTWEGFAADVPDGTASTLTMNQTDVVLYYNLLDETAFMTLDLGVDVKILDLEFDIASATERYNESTTLPLPMLYARGRVNVPATDLALEADIKYFAISDSQVYDARIKADYTLSFVPVVQPALEVGYRIQKVEIDENSVDLTSDLEFSGIYAGLMVRF